MISIFDPDNLPPVRLEIAEALQNAREDLHSWEKRTISSALVLLLGCTSAALFWRYSFDRYFILLLVPLLLVFTYCGGMLWGAWTCLQEVQRDARGLPKIRGVDQP